MILCLLWNTNQDIVKKTFFSKNPDLDGFLKVWTAKKQKQKKNMKTILDVV